MDSLPTPKPPSGGRIAAAALGALVMAGIVLVVAVLPAEYGIDPLGTGRALGLDRLATPTGGRPTVTAFEGSPDPIELEPVRPGANTPQAGRVRRDAVEFEVGPFEGLEYKYRLEKGGAMVYSWTATGDVKFDFHGEPDGARDGYAESYEQKERVKAANGTFFAPTPGIHGWFWENQTSDVITIRLTSSGFYSAATEFREDGRRPHAMREQ